MRQVHTAGAATYMLCLAPVDANRQACLCQHILTCLQVVREQSTRLRFTSHVYDPHALGGVHEEFASKFFIAGEVYLQHHKSWLPQVSWTLLLMPELLALVLHREDDT
jgi:hypothetical protein